ncbi:DUF4062 domain-containing protein [Bacteroides acidifaciens]|jgi:hypothetical protein|uniref:DUF4062 domain-containing protein n=1 Tax=Bacteroides acidifaciens TaxID=85831 RepID=UPI0025ADC8BB|nr:DUF4062 domain-containing protein [Bacteroides acidifaciens]
MDKRYQVFISSTYSDLKEERGKVMQTVMSLDCIPAGMEFFTAIDSEQLEFIKKIIDDCDYYILIIGGKYGSMTEDGISYTEQEYNYAVSKGIRVLAFLHKNINQLTTDKIELDQNKREKLEAFRDRVKTGRLVQFWSNADELNGKVAVSLTKTIKTYPAVGWVRGNTPTNEETLQEINELRKELDELRKYKYEKEKSGSEIENIASLDEKISLTGYHGTHHYKWEINLSWKELFSLISPFFLESHNDYFAKQIISEVLIEETGRTDAYKPELCSKDFQTIKIQMRALGLMHIAPAQTTKGGQALFWTLSQKGVKLMNDLRVIRHSASTETDD